MKQIAMTRNSLVRFLLVAALAVGCRSEKAVLSAAETPNNSAQPAGSVGAYPPRVAPTQAGPGGVAWSTMRDDRELAFSIEVPAGWKAFGGMFRYRIAYPRPSVEMVSPDGRVDLLVGDPTIPNYQTPVANPYHLPRTPGGPPVAPFATGDVFAGKYGLARFSSMCQSIELKGSQPTQPKYGNAGQGAAQGYVQSTAGFATFTCEKNGEPMAGYVYAETMLVKAAMWQPANWYVTAMGSYLAPASQSQVAQAMLQHSGESIAMNPQWLLFQHKLVAYGTAINLNTAAETMKSIQQMNERQDKWRKMMAGEVDDFNDILNGTTYTVDPSTGKTWEVPTGPGGQKWMNDQQTVVSSAMQPGPSFHALDTISRQAGQP